MSLWYIEKRYSVRELIFIDSFGADSSLVNGRPLANSRRPIMLNPKADEIEERLIQFGIDIMELTEQFPSGVHATHLARQITRSATAAAPNHAEARVAESRPDFIHKMGIALKELNETHVWLRMAARKFGLDSDFLKRLI